MPPCCILVLLITVRCIYDHGQSEPPASRSRGPLCEVTQCPWAFGPRALADFWYPWAWGEPCLYLKPVRSMCRRFAHKICICNLTNWDISLTCIKLQTTYLWKFCITTSISWIEQTFSSSTKVIDSQPWSCSSWMQLEKSQCPPVVCSCQQDHIHPPPADKPSVAVI